MGLQTLSILVAQDPSVLEYRAFTGSMVPCCPWISRRPPPAASSSPRQHACWNHDTITEKNSTCNLHHDGVDPCPSRRMGDLRTFSMCSPQTLMLRASPLSLRSRPRGPVFWLQWHPERPQFEWRPADNDPIGQVLMSS